jgi:hypothetical protein
MLIYGSANLLFMGPNIVGVPLVVTENMRGTAAELSFLQGAFAAGMVAGGLVLSVRPPTRRRLLVITTVIALEGVLLAILGNVRGVLVGVLLEFAIGVGVITNNVPMMSLIQQYADRAKVGRIMSLNTVASMGLSPLSYAIVTALISLRVDIGVILPAFGLTMSALMIVMSVRIPTIRTVD